MYSLEANLGLPSSGTVVSIPTGGEGAVEGDLLRALLKAGHVEARVLQVLSNQSALIDFLSLGKAVVRSEAALRPGDVFTAAVEPAPEGSADPVKLKIAELRHEPAAPMKPERLAAALVEMRLPADAKHQAMASALLRHAGTVNREALLRLNEALSRLASTLSLEPPASKGGSAPQAVVTAQGMAPASTPKLPVPPRVLEAAAFLVARGLPVTEEAVEWVSGRMNPASTSGERLGAIVKQIPESATLVAQALAELEVPDGDAAETAAHLVKLARALTPPEARIARLLESEVLSSNKETVKTVPPDSQPAARSSAAMRGASEPLRQIQEAVTSVLERAVRAGEGAESIREALAEVRFGQLVNVSASDSQQAQGARELAIPLWWTNGSGEIRVQYQAREGRKAAAGEPAETRVVVTLDTAQLQRVKVDLLLGRKQLNCQVSVEEPAIADLLRRHLPELEEALAATGLRVNALGVKHVARKATPQVVDGLRQVDVWL